MSTKQLYEKTSEGMKEVSPLVSIEDIYSKLSDTPLEALVSLFNHVKCEWKGSVSDTRRTVPLFLRRSGLFITYNNGTKFITEFFSAGADQNSSEDIEETKEIQLNNDYLVDGINYGELKKQYDFVTISNKANRTSFKIFGFDYFGNQNPTLAPNESCVFANYNGKYICISINQLRNIRSYKNHIPNAPSINGVCLYNEEIKKVVYSYNGSWVDALGNNALAKYNGTTQQRPTEINLGFQYFDTTLNKPIWWTGKKMGRCYWSRCIK